MAYKPAKRNWEGIQFEELRKVVDKKFNDAHDKLSVLYYDEWKNGDFSNDFYGYKPSNQSEAKPLFNKLHGLIFNLRDMALDKTNEARANPDQKLHNQFHQIKERKTKKTIKKIKDRIAQLKSEGIELNI